MSRKSNIVKSVRSFGKRAYKTNLAKMGLGDILSSGSLHYNKSSENKKVIVTFPYSIVKHG